MLTSLLLLAPSFGLASLSCQCGNQISCCSIAIMGNGASLLSAVVAEHPEMLGHYREEIAIHFLDEYSRLKARGLSDEEIKREFIQGLRDKESAIFARVAESEAKDKKFGDDDEHEKLFIERCNRSAHTVATRRGINYLCCVDGSDVAEIAFQLCMCLRRKHDNVEIFHAFKESKNEALAPEYLPGAIRRRYDDQLKAQMSTQNYSFHFEERYSRSAYRTLQDFLDHCNDSTNPYLLPAGHKTPDFVVLGHAGRKRVAGGRHGGSETSLGSTAELALRSIHVPCIIAKRNCPLSGSMARVFMLTVNFSECSKRGLDILLPLVGPRDTLRLVFVQRPEADAEKVQRIQNYYENELHQNGPFDSKFVRLRIDHHQSIANAIIDHVNGPHSPDFLALSPRARPSYVHSPITEQVIMNARPSIILCKN
jgi:hypothetical protein